MEALAVHLLDDMQNAPFVLKDELPLLPVRLTGPEEARLIVGRRKSMFVPEQRRPDQKHLLWTHEPFFDRTATHTVPNFFPENFDDRNLYVFNVHNGLVYTDNFYLAPRAGKLRNITTEADLNVPFSDKGITFAATFKLSRCLVEEQDRSLNAARCELALDLHKRGRMRIIGREWPDGVAEDESRFENRARAKNAFLKSANFNFCYENCDADYYVTEKLWESIIGGCLPIYWSCSTIYQTFSKGSFIDGRDFADPDALLAFIDAMTFEDYQRRINLCRRAFNLAVKDDMRLQSRLRSNRRLASFLKMIRG